MKNFLNTKIFKKIIPIFVFGLILSGFFAIGLRYTEAALPKGTTPCPDADLAAQGYWYEPAKKQCRHASGHTVPYIAGKAEEGAKNEAKSGSSIGQFLLWALGQFLNVTLFTTIGPMLLAVMGAILGFAGVAFNQAIEFSVLNMANHVNGLEAIDVGWALFRDLVNMFLIFILLYVSIRTILGVGNFKTTDTIKNVIIVALFINFSLFATRLVIDVSNVLATGMYNNIQGSVDKKGESSVEVEAGAEKFIAKNIGLSGAIMRPLLLTFAYNPEVQEGSTASLAGALWGEGAITNILTDPFKVFITTVMGAIMMLVAAFVFIAGAGMFLVRFVVLVFLMVASPIAFGSLAFPGLNKNFDKWLDYLIKYSFFAPIYLFLIYFVAYFLNNSNIIKAGDNWSIIINFVIAIIMMLLALVAANSAGIAGSKFIREKAGEVTFGWSAAFARNTVGRRGYQMTQDEDLLKKAAEGDWSAKTKLYFAQKAATSSFDARKVAPVAAAGKWAGGIGDVDKIGAKGYAEVQKKKSEELEKFNKDVIGGGQGTDEEKLDRRKLHMESLEKPTFMQRITERFGEANKDEKGNVVARGPGIRDITKDTYLAGDVAGYASDIEAAKKIKANIQNDLDDSNNQVLVNDIAKLAEKINSISEQDSEERDNLREEMQKLEKRLEASKKRLRKKELKDIIDDEIKGVRGDVDSLKNKSSDTGEKKSDSGEGKKT